MRMIACEYLKVKLMTKKTSWEAGERLFNFVDQDAGRN
jgi:hypothetical protein